MKMIMGALATEWVKLRSVRSTWWAVIGAVVLMAIVCTATGSDARSGAEPAGAIVGPSVMDAMMNFGEWAVLVPAIVAITAEYSTRSITVSLQCVPIRPRLLLSKAFVVGLGGLVLGLIAAVAGLAATVIALGRSNGIDAGETARTVVLIAVYTAMISMLALGVGFLTRSTAATATLVFLLVMIIPSLLAQLGRLLGSKLISGASDYFPGVAARIMISGDAGSYGPGLAALVLAGWVVASLGAAIVVFEKRDA